MAAGARARAGVRTTRQNTGTLKPAATPSLDHSIHWSTRARAAPSAGQNGAVP